MALREALTDEKRAYDGIKNLKQKFGVYQKTCFHLHTPASHDYTLYSDWSDVQYKAVSEEDLYKICVENKIIITGFDINFFKENIEFKIYSNTKELLSYLVLAEELLQNEIVIVVVADHHTFSGVDKLRLAIEHIHKSKKIRYNKLRK